MDTSRRAVEAYWRSRMIDGATSDEDKVAPVYKLEEICELLRGSDVSIVKEVSEYIFKRLDHKSPVVKQKTLRLIKYAVGKSGTEFRREMQRHSAVMRQLFHYKGQPDPLKGDALNKAVRDAAHEVISAVFATEDSKPATPAEGLNKRIQGFGNTNFDMPVEDKKSFLSEVVGLGSASIKQGLSTIAAAHLMKKTDNGTYKSPNLHRSLTTEIDSRSYEVDSYQRENQISSGVSKNASSGTWGHDMPVSMASTAANEDNNLSHTGVKSREERLLETIVTSGGVRLQPTRDAMQTFLTQALKLDAVAMSHALEMKLQSHLWQVRMKAICVLEAILRKKDEEHFSIIVSYFSENRDSVVRCSELPQASLREKANRVLSLLEGDQTTGARRQSEEPSGTKEMPVSVVQMPDLIDTGDPDDFGSESSSHKQVDQRVENLTSTGSLVDDLFGSDPIDCQNTTGNPGEHDPFADVSFHVTEDKEQDDIFSGLTVDKGSDVGLGAPSNKKSDLLDVFSDNSEQVLYGKETDKRNVHDLMDSLTLSGNVQDKQPRLSGGAFSGTPFFDGSSQPSQLPTNGALNGLLGSNSVYPLASMQYNMPPNIMFNQSFATQPMNYGAMGAFIAQQQLLFQNLGNINAGFGHTTGNSMEGGYPSPLPDIFQLSNNPVQSQGTMMNISKKEETKAFDFISDHVSAARDSKRMI